MVDQSELSTCWIRVADPRVGSDWPCLTSWIRPCGAWIRRWRLITDLSSPAGRSVNDGVESLLCSLSYVSVDDAVRRIKSMGRGTLLAKFDIASAYRMVPVHPADHMLWACCGKGNCMSTAHCLSTCVLHLNYSLP